MSEIIKQTVNCSNLIETTPSITVGEIVENYIVPKFPKAQYTTNNKGYPCIVLPCIDGNYRNDFNPVIVFEVDTTAVAKSSGSVTTRVGITKMNTKETFVYDFGYRYRSSNSSSDSYNSGNYTSIDFHYVITWWEYTYDNIRSLGIVSISHDYTPITMLSMDIMITKCKTLDTDEEVDVVMVAGGNRINEIRLVYPYKGSIVKTTIPRWTLPTVDETINVYQFNDGNIYNDNLYICFPLSHTILKPLATFNSKSQPVHLDTWNKEAFTIGGKKFDLKLTSASDGEYVSIAKKVQ